MVNTSIQNILIWNIESTENIVNNSFPQQLILSKLNGDVSLEGLTVINPRSILEKNSEKRIRKEKPYENEFLKKPNVNYVC